MISNLVLALSLASSPVTSEAPVSALAAAQKLVGVYDGTGRMFGMLATGEIVPRSQWTEVVTATNPRIEDGRAIVDVRSDMTGVGADWTYTLNFTEGYIVEDDGSAGTRFFVMEGNFTPETKVGEGEYEYGFTIPGEYLTKEALEGLGVLVPLKDVLVVRQQTKKKVAINSEGREQDDVVTKTAVKWKTADGSEKVTVFTSMISQHLRRP